MGSDFLSYATRSSNGSSRWRRVLLRIVRYIPLGILLLSIVAGIVITANYPWVWYGSKKEYQWHRWLTFSLPPEKVVYEEDPANAARLLATAPEPNGAYVGDPKGWPDGGERNYMSRRGRPPVMYCPPTIRALASNREGLVFVHGRSNSKSGGALMVVLCHWIISGADQTRPGVIITARRCTHDECVADNRKYLDTRPGWIALELFLRPDQIMRIYAGQPDPKDDAHFTIKYEIDNVPGLIDGRLENDDTVTLKILSGPATTQPATPTTPPATAPAGR